MRSTFFGLETTLRALEAQRGAADVVAHNIANAQTPGYTRQVAHLTASAPYRPADMTGPTGAGSWGTGVSIEDISRVRNAFLDRQVRTQSSWQGRYTALESTLSAAQAALDEPSDTGLSASFDAYQKAWQAVADDPGNIAARRVLLQNAASLGSNISQLDGNWIAVRDDVDHQVQSDVGQLNTLAANVASLNEQIVGVKVAGQNPNDLMDQRDALLDKMSGLVPIQTRTREDGSVDVWVGGMEMVSGKRADSLQAATDGAGGLSVTWTSTGAPLQIARGASGALGGLLDLRQVVIPGYRQQLADIAKTLSDKTNQLHAAGFGLDGSTNLQFFDYGAPTATQALRLQVSADVAGHPEKVAAASTSPAGVTPAGDGSNASALAAVLDEPLLGSGTTSVVDAYRGLVGEVGADTLEASTRSQHTQALMTNLQGQQQSTEGVSMDEEMAHLVQYQQAYQAAAQTFTAIDNMIGTIVQNLGHAGM